MRRWPRSICLGQLLWAATTKVRHPRDQSHDRGQMNLTDQNCFTDMCHGNSSILCSIGQARSIETRLRMYNHLMPISARTRRQSQPTKRRRTRRIPLSAIQRLAREIADKFQPDKIILFGSYAYGKPHQDSDVDLLVVMSAWNETSKACRIRLAVHHPFPWT